jgi:hypothetical protein
LLCVARALYKAVNLWLGCGHACLRTVNSPAISQSATILSIHQALNFCG